MIFTPGLERSSERGVGVSGSLVKLASEDRLDPVFAAGFLQLDMATRVSVVCEGKGLHSERGYAGNMFLDRPVSIPVQ